MHIHVLCANNVIIFICVGNCNRSVKFVSRKQNPYSTRIIILRSTPEKNSRPERTISMYSLVGSGTRSETGAGLVRETERRRRRLVRRRYHGRVSVGFLWQESWNRIRKTRYDLLPDKGFECKTRVTYRCSCTARRRLGSTVAGGIWLKPCRTRLPPGRRPFCSASSVNTKRPKRLIDGFGARVIWYTIFVSVCVW